MFFIIIALIAPFSVIFSQTTVCLDAGHGGDDPGTLGYDGPGYPNEEDITLAIATATEGEMRDVFGVLNVYMTRIGDYAVSLDKRVKIANGEEPDAYGYYAPEDGVDYFISIHCNSSSDASIHGTQVYVWSSENKYDPPDYQYDWDPDPNTARFKLASNIMSSYLAKTSEVYVNARFLESSDAADGIIGKNFYVLRETNMPANLIETEFASCKESWNQLQSSDYQTKAAEGITEGLQITTGVGDVFANFTATPGTREIVLNWHSEKYSSNPWSEFQIYRSIDGGDNYNYIGSIPYTGDGDYTYTDNNASYDHKYHYKVYTDEFYGPVSTVPYNGYTPPLPSAPAISVQEIGDGYVKLAINSNGSYVLKYKIYYDTDGYLYDNYQIFAAGSEYELSVTKGYIYYIAARSVNNAGESGYSNQVSAYVPVYPATPTNLVAFGGGSSISLSWNPADGASGYSVYRSCSKGFTPNDDNFLESCNDNNYVDKNILNGRLYFYKVCAYNSSGRSGYSNEAYSMAGNVIWVDDSNTGFEDGSQQHPFNTINEGIQAATSGYVVCVNPGTYHETVSMKTGVNLIGYDNAVTKIEVSGYCPAVCFQNITNSELSGFKLKGYVAVKCDNADDVIIKGNHIYGSWAGIYLYESSPEIKHNIITGNDFGIYAWSHSDPEVYDAYNDISGNDYGVRCSSNSEPALGYYYDYTKGNNNISNITWDVYAYSTSQTVLAIYNYWQNGGIPKVHHENSSYSIEYEPMLEENPLGKALVDNPVAINLKGLRLFYEKRFREALREFKYVIDNYPHHPVAPFALDNLMMTYKKIKRQEEVLLYLRSLAQSYPDDLLGGMASEFIIPFELEQGDFNGVITRINSLRDRFSRNELGKNVFFKLGMIYKYHMGNKEKAEKIFRQIIERYPKEEIARLAEMELHTMDLSLPCLLYTSPSPRDLSTSRMPSSA